MTPEQVSALSNAELERAMRDCYMPYWKSDKDILRIVRAGKVNYLTDYNLTMPLVIENNLKVDTRLSKVSATGHYPTTTNTVILRAACECLVLIALADK